MLLNKYIFEAITSKCLAVLAFDFEISLNEFVKYYLVRNTFIPGFWLTFEPKPQPKYTTCFFSANDTMIEFVNKYTSITLRSVRTGILQLFS